MDIRPLIHLWLNKPEVYGGCGYHVANMRTSVFSGELSGNSGQSSKVWGNDYSMLELWIDLDRSIKNTLEPRDFITLGIYVTAMLETYGNNWERWKALPHYIVEQLRVIAYDILEEGKE
jgi:hypothetical protein